MAFVIFIKTPTGEIKKAWHLPDKKPEVGNITTLMATQGELKHVDFLFRNIPIVRAESCTWTGEMAQFIFDNL